MKKLNTQLRCILALLLCIASTAMWADTYSHTIGATTWTANGTQTLSGIAWNLNAIFAGESYWGYEGARGQQIGNGKGKPATSIALSTSGISGTITSVKITTSGASSVVANVAISVGGTAFKTATDATTQSISATYCSTSY